MRRRTFAAWLAFALTVPLCACTGNGPGDITRPNARNSSTTTKPADPSVPTVSNPIDLNDYRGTPCNLLNATELAGLELGDAKGNDSGTDCHYTDDLVSRSFLLRLYPKESRLADAYHLDKDDYELFEPIEIRGMPAVKEARPKDKPENTTCSVIVGVAENQSVVLYYNPMREVRPDDAEATCAKVVRVAEAVLGRLGA